MQGVTHAQTQVHATCELKVHLSIMRVSLTHSPAYTVATHPARALASAAQAWLIQGPT